VAAIAAATAALPACNSGEGLVSLPNEDDASVSDAANETAAGCFAQNACTLNSDCLAATCDCEGGQTVPAADRCVNHCCLSVYAACLRACADAGDGASDAGDGASDASPAGDAGNVDNDATEDSAVDVSTDS
jgi:hypothetical protein